MLVDTSVLHRVGRHQVVADRIADLRRTGRLWTCDMVTLELGYSARNAADWSALSDAQARLPQAATGAQVMARAVEVQGMLAARGVHRVKLPDLIIAAAGEAAGIAVLHYDSDFDLIAGVTGQEVEWVAERGTID
ncbi:MAG: PIN domain-containing protein [Acidimicrobiia bacterium]